MLPNIMYGLRLYLCNCSVGYVMDGYVMQVNVSFRLGLDQSSVTYSAFYIIILLGA